MIRTVARLGSAGQILLSRGFWSGICTPAHTTGSSVRIQLNTAATRKGMIPNDIDWLIYAKTDRYYIKKYQAETNITGYLVMDLSESMAYTYRQELSKFEYSVCLAAALGYMMIHQQDPVGLITFDEKIPATAFRPARKRTQFSAISLAAGFARLKPVGPTEIATQHAPLRPC